MGGGAIFANAGDINGDDRVDLTAVTDNGLSVLLSGQSESATLSNVAFFGCGAQSVTATYGGDGNYGQSTSSALTFTPAKQNTALTLTVTPANGVTGQQITLQATLAPYAYGSTTTNGEVGHLYDNGNTIGTAPLASGVAVLNIALPFNTNDSFRATYAGDCAFNNSNSNRVTGSTLNSSILTWPNPAPITYGTPLSGTQLNATDNAPGGGTFTYTPPAGTVLPAGTSTLSVTFNPTNPTYGNETATVPDHRRPGANRHHLADTHSDYLRNAAERLPVGCHRIVRHHFSSALSYYNVYGIYSPVPSTARVGSITMDTPTPPPPSVQP